MKVHVTESSKDEPERKVTPEIEEIIKAHEFLSLDDSLKLTKLFSTVHLKKGDYLFKNGGDRKVCFIVNGLLRSYMVRSVAEESTINFLFSGDSSFSRHLGPELKASNEHVVALEDSTVLTCSYQTLKEELRRLTSIAQLFQSFLETNYEDAIERIEILGTAPSQRYDYLIKRKPEILKRVPQKFIASYIGITPVSLSRLRSRVSKKSKLPLNSKK